MRWSHIVLFVLAVAASTGRYVLSPFPPGSENPVVALMALDAPILLWVMHGWYAAMPGTVVFIGGTLVLGVWRVWFEPTPRKKHGKGELPPWPITALDEKPAIVVGEDASPGRGAGGSQPGVARDPGARPLYRGRHLRGGRLREDLGVHAPVCPTTVRLASEEPEASGDWSGPRSQGGFLLRHPGDSRKGRPGRRLHGTEHGREMAVESPGRALARCLLPGLYRFLSPESVCSARGKIRSGNRPTRTW